MALSDAIRIGDTVEGAANSSTAAMPRPVGMWLHPDRARAEGGAFTVQLAHRCARAGRPVAAVHFVVSGGTESVEALVSSMEVIAYAASGMLVPHLAATLDLTTLALDALLTLEAMVYLWVGGIYNTRLHGAPVP